MDCPTWVGNSAWPTNCQGNPRAGIVEAGFRPRKGHAVIACHDHDGVVELPGFFKRRDGLLDHGIEVLDLDEVVENVTAHDVVVREDWWDDDFVRILSSSLSGTKFIAAVRFGRPKPETEGTALWRILEKVGKIARVVRVAHRLERRLHLPGLIFDSGRILVAPARLKAPRTPAFARISHVVTRLLQHLRVGGELCRQGAVDVSRFFEPPDGLARQDGAARRSTGRRIAEGMNKTQPFASNPVESGGLHDGIPVRPGVGVALVVGNAEEDIGPFLRERADGEDCEREENADDHGLVTTSTLPQNPNSQAQSLARFSSSRSTCFPANLVRSISSSNHSFFTVS